MSARFQHVCQGRTKSSPRDLVDYFVRETNSYALFHRHAYGRSNLLLAAA
jgi:hypothetical protein